MTPGGSKFFTWTKGDRKHVTSGMVQIPVECIEIKGLGYGRNVRVILPSRDTPIDRQSFAPCILTWRKENRWQCLRSWRKAALTSPQGSRKRGRKPLPLNFSDTKSEYSAQSHESFTLHEAAVQSATSLIAAMSDMLKSPHFNGGPRSCELRPPQGRLRSHTAPPTPATPLVEAPHPEPVELPATDSIWPARHRGASILAGSLPTTNERQRTQAARPQSTSPQGLTQPPDYENIHNSDNDQGSDVLRPSLDSTLCGKSDECFRTPNRSQESLEKPASSTRMKTPKWQLPRTPRRDDKEESPTASGERIQGLEPQHDAHLVPESPDQSKCDMSKISGMMTQVANMRSAHEAHIATLKAAHDQEIASYRAYVVLLEQQHSLLRLSEPRQSLSIDTTHHRGRTISAPTASRTGTLQSLDSLSMDPARPSPEPLADAEALKRRLALANKTNADLGEVRRERDRLKDSDCQKERRITQLKDIIRKTKESEQAQKTAAVSLQADLAAANMQRDDVLAGLDDVYKDLRSSYQREARLRGRCEELQSYIKEAGCVESALPIRPMHRSAGELIRGGELTTDPTKRYSAVPQASMSELEQHATTQLDGEFKCGREACQQTHDRLEIAMKNIQNLQARLLDCQEHLKAAQADRERYNCLLHTELRRQSKIAGSKEQVATPELQREISKSLATRLQGASASPSSKELQSTRSLSAKDQAWEQELRHCVKEIIMYKLDVRGYKKDLKLATAKIESLEAEVRARTAESRAHETTQDGQAEVPLKHNLTSSMEQRPGLGISLTQQRSSSTPNALNNSRIERPPQSTGSQQPELGPALTCTSPYRQTTTPLSIHKQLPLPPPLESMGPTRQSSPPSASSQNHVQIQRAETLRSLSDSIISSYTKRDETSFPLSEQSSRSNASTPRPIRISRGGGGGRPPSCGTESRQRLSRGNSAVLMPISRFSSGMLKAPRAVEVTAGRD